jgi:hypothetical protein
MSTITDNRLEIVPGHPKGLIASYPNTGFWCGVCGLPLHRYLDKLGSHPNCLDTIPTASSWIPRALAEKKGGSYAYRFEA